MEYNIKAEDFGDTIYYTFYPSSIITGYEKNNKKYDNVKIDSKKNNDNDKNNNNSNSDKNVTDEKENIRRSLLRTKQKIYSYAKSNEWTHFFTLTFDPKKVDRYDYNDCVKWLSKFLNLIRKQNKDIKYIFVPERHKDGAYHFHGIVGNAPNLKIVPSGVYSLGKYTFKEENIPENLKNDLGSKLKQIYNLKNYKYGFSDVSLVEDTKRVSSYITKYITKDLCTHTKGKKRYWCTKNLKLPEETKVYMTDEQKALLIEDMRKSGCISFEKEHIVKTPVGDVTIRYIEIVKKDSNNDKNTGKQRIYKKISRPPKSP